MLPAPAVTAAPALAKVRRRLIPLLFVLYVVAYLDRVNVSFAATEMQDDLGLSAAAYGLGAISVGGAGLALGVATALQQRHDP